MAWWRTNQFSFFWIIDLNSQVNIFRMLKPESFCNRCQTFFKDLKSLKKISSKTTLVILDFTCIKLRYKEVLLNHILLKVIDRECEKTKKFVHVSLVLNFLNVQWVGDWSKVWGLSKNHKGWSSTDDAHGHRWTRVYQGASFPFRLELPKASLQ